MRRNIDIQDAEFEFSTSSEQAVESRGPTTADWMAGVLVLSLCLVLPVTPAPVLLTARAALLFWLLRLFFCLPAAIAAVSLMRHWQFKRPLYVAEWFAITLSMWGLSFILPDIDTTSVGLRLDEFLPGFSERRIVLGMGAVCSAIALEVLCWTRSYGRLALVRTGFRLWALVLLFWLALPAFALEFEFPFAVDSQTNVGNAMAQNLFIADLRSVIVSLPWQLGLGLLGASAILSSLRHWNALPWTCLASAFLASLLTLAFAATSIRSFWTLSACLGVLFFSTLMAVLIVPKASDKSADLES